METKIKIFSGTAWDVEKEMNKFKENCKYFFVMGIGATNETTIVIVEYQTK